MLRCPARLRKLPRLGSCDCQWQRSAGVSFKVYDRPKLNGTLDVKSYLEAALPAAVNQKASQALVKRLQAEKEFLQVLATSDYARVSGGLYKVFDFKTSKNMRHSKIDTKIQETYLNETLATFAQVCKLSGEFKLAEIMLSHARTAWRKLFAQASTTPPFPSLSVFESYLDLSLTSTTSGSKENFLNLWAQLKKQGHALSPKVLGQALLFLNQFGPKDPRKTEFAASVLQDMEKSAVSFQDIYAQSFSSAQFEDLTTAIQSLAEDFQSPKNEKRVVDRGHNNVLVENLGSEGTRRLSPLSSDPEYLKKIPELLQRQLRLELKGSGIVPSLLCDPGINAPSKIKPRHCVSDLKSQLMAQWRRALIMAFSKNRVHYEASVHEVKEGDLNKAGILLPFYQALSPEELAALCLEVVQKMLEDSEHYSPGRSLLSKEIGDRVMKLCLLKLKIDDPPFHSSEGTEASTQSNLNQFYDAYNSYLGWLSNPQNSSSWSHRQSFIESITPGEDAFFANFTDWQENIKRVIGSDLLTAIQYNVQFCTDSLGISVVGPDDAENLKSMWGESSPVFFSVSRKRGSLTIQETKAHPKIVEIFCDSYRSSLLFDATELPMLVPPIPWTDQSRGGNLLLKNNCIRSFFGMTQMPEWSRQDPVKITPLLDCLNVLGSTPWKIQQTILDLVTEVFQNPTKYESYLSQLGISKHPDHLEIPIIPESIKEKLQSKTVLSAEDMAAYKAYNTKKQVFQQFKGECLSLWTSTLYRLSIANHFRDEILYFVHNIDFRGRCYPIPPHFNHMGDDLSRSLLVFAEGKKLGRDGFKWLKLHAVNLTGSVKKKSVEDRLLYAEDVFDDMIDSARDPFGGRLWWLQSEDPWQTLAACLEIKAAFESGDPENFVSHLPVHQDGSCNGLQHYAALGRDILGGEYVNLLPSAIPKDVYSEIATIVERKRKIDAEAGVEIAIALDGMVDRKVVKQTIMTTVYGVTFYGAKLQVAKQLKTKEGIAPKDIKNGSTYLARKVFESLNETFESSQNIQSWFTNCAHETCSLLFENVSWHTPLGLKVVQPYSSWGRPNNAPGGKDESATKVVSRSFFSQQGVKLNPKTVKQKNAFPPNFIHSLDSSHMMLTTLNMWDQGLTFAMVHDCFWTRAADVDAMNKICREQFVNLHSYPILEELSNHFLGVLRDTPSAKNLRRFQKAKLENLFKDIPVKGNLDLNDVKKSTFFFS